jgi:hypothetical protein
MIYDILKNGIPTEINGGELYSHPRSKNYKFDFPLFIDTSTIIFHDLSTNKEIEYIPISDTYTPELWHIKYAMCMKKSNYLEMIDNIDNIDNIIEDLTYEELKKILEIEEIPVFNRHTYMGYVLKCIND